MNNNFVLSCCSTVDLTREYLEKRSINFIPFHFRLGDTEYYDDFGASVPLDEFYRRMEEGEPTSTSQVNMSEYIAYFSEFARQGLDVLHLCISSGISGTYNSALSAAGIVSARFPGVTVRVIDTLCGSSGYGLITDAAADMRNDGCSLSEISDFIEENRLRLNHWFFSTDLKYYIRGGRVSKTSGMIGTVLNICPLLRIDGEGRLVPFRKCRGKKKVIREIEKMMELNADGGTSYGGKCFICHSACEDDAKALSELIVERFPNLKSAPEIFPIGTTIGSHTGPGTVALFFWGNMRP